MTMTREAIERRRDALIAEFGAWTGNNIHLGHGVYTIGPRLAGMAEARVERALTLVEDFAGKPLEDLRILDLGALEGGFSVALAERGAQVVALEGRERNAEKARFAAEALGLERMTVMHEDVRRLAALELGSFDVALCLGLLYHLPAAEAVALVRQLARQATGFAIVETQVGLRPRVRHADEGGREYWGIAYAEDTANAGASIENQTSFWPTRPSLFNMLTDAGFSSVCECRTPLVAELDAYLDHVTLVAVPGRRDRPARWPERLPPASHPAQGPIHWARDRLRRGRGGGVTSVFAKRRR